MTRVLLFGRLAEIAGWSEREMSLEGRVSDLKAHLRGEAAALQALDSKEVQVAVDQVLVRDDVQLDQAREIAFLPAFSGG